MRSILIVDDSGVDRRLAGAILEKAGGWTIDYAVDGIEALEKLKRGHFQIVLTDLLMPGLNGLELMAEIRRKHPQVPVVLMTSRGSEEIAMQALDQGAAGYVPKRFLPGRLPEVVERLLLVSQAHHERSPLLDRMTEVQSKFVLPNDTRLGDLLVRLLQDQAIQMGLCDQIACMRMGVAIQEAMVNAIHHGNLEVGSECREGIDAQYHALVAQRAGQPPYCDRSVHVSVRLTREEAEVSIRDEGKGFDCSQLPDPRQPANLEKASGRGILLMRSFMDEVRFDDQGRSVTLVKRRH